MHESSLRLQVFGILVRQIAKQNRGCFKKEAEAIIRNSSFTNLIPEGDKMPKALVCINTDFYAAEEVLAELQKCKEVEEAFRVHGVYDVIAKIHAKSTEHLLDIVTRYIKRLHNVQTAHTMLIIEPDNSSKERRQLLV